MGEKSIFRNKLFVVTVIACIVLLFSVFFLMNYVQNLLYSDVRITLMEIVSQNKDVISSKLLVELNNMELASQQVSDRIAENGGAVDHESVKEAFLSFAQSKGGETLCWADANGDALYANGQTVSVAGRRYFQLAMQGSQNISERTVSRLNGEDIFILAVPLRVEGNIIGTIQKQYTPQEIYHLCSVSLFSDQGYMYVINEDGYILISSQQDSYSRESDNYYRMVFLGDPEASKQIERDIRGGRSGFIETTLDGQKVFSAYTPIDQIYGWYLISSVATNAVSPNAGIVVRMFYIILCAVVLFFACLMLYYLYAKHRQQRELRRLAFEDDVTGGNTYTKFTVDLPKILSAHKDRQFYIFVFDIDNFKYINSYYGYETGDRILRRISGMYGSLMLQNELLARTTGDHFVALLEDASEARLADLFSSEVCVEGITVYLSAGLYSIADPTESVNLMVDKATAAVKEIKGMRYKRVAVYSEEFGLRITKNEQLKRAVEQALVDGEIIPYYQPKVDIKTRRLVGAEALARWKKKDGTLVSPGEFIPVCEQTGLIVMVDLAIFKNTLQFIRSNLEKNVECVPISVNFSRMHLLNEDFLNSLLKMMREYGVPPRLIELELTETVIFDNFQSINDFIGRLHESGIQISMDDFGSGYSSLHMLKDVDIDVLKIDRGFLQGVANSDRQRTIFGAIVRMAKGLKMKVVVEGVENVENIELMDEFGCYIAQGFYYSRPLAPEIFQKFYEEGKVC